MCGNSVGLDLQQCTRCGEVRSASHFTAKDNPELKTKKCLRCRCTPDYCCGNLTNAKKFCCNSSPATIRLLQYFWQMMLLSMTMCGVLPSGTSLAAIGRRLSEIVFTSSSICSFGSSSVVHSLLVAIAVIVSYFTFIVLIFTDCLGYLRGPQRGRMRIHIARKKSTRERRQLCTTTTCKRREIYGRLSWLFGTIASRLLAANRHWLTFSSSRSSVDIAPASSSSLAPVIATSSPSLTPQRLVSSCQPEYHAWLGSLHDAYSDTPSGAHRSPASHVVQIFVRADERTLAVLVNVDDSFASLVEKIAARLGQSLEFSYLAYHGKVLRSQFVLRDYNIQDGSTLEFLPRLLSGAPGKTKGKRTATDANFRDVPDDDDSCDEYVPSDQDVSDSDLEIADDDEFQPLRESEVFDAVGDEEDDQLESQRGKEIESLFYRAEKLGLQPDPRKLRKNKQRMRPPRSKPREDPIMKIPIDRLKQDLNDRLYNLLLVVDKKFSNFDDIVDDNPVQFRTQIVNHLLGHHTQSTNADEMIHVFSAYTGRALRLDASPVSSSLESIYHYAVAPSGHIGYHVAANTVLVESFLNFTKRNMSIMTLPLAAEIMRTWDRPLHWDAKRVRLQWLVNAAANVAILQEKYQCHSKHVQRHKQWVNTIRRNRDPALMLEAMRTGRSTSTDAELERFRSTLTNWDGVFSGHYWTRKGDDDLSISTVKETLLKIAASHGLSKKEFLACCTISDGNDWVFFPFTPLTANMAIAMGWDWKMLRRWSTHRFFRIKHCNYWAEAFGIAEIGLSPVKILYSCAHITFERIATKKEQFCLDGRDLSDNLVLNELACEAIVDRFNIPIVPWQKHAFAASLCKKFDHGVEMRTGFGDIEVDDPIFDPTNWNSAAEKCTVTIDTMMINMGMVDFHPETWKTLPLVLRDVPWQHPLWDIDDSLGNQVWGLSETVCGAFPPHREYDTSILLPIEAWSQGGIAIDLRCRFSANDPCFAMHQAVFEGLQRQATSTTTVYKSIHKMIKI
ncbi:hypothetical protein PFICI_09727 [Pestalotiopsis fici W106-1]|uniref:Ubiquitin-like domain-containing protein n=1 Tax=Pestalotiopsis fici (strain W106-1 / CGMCC3.15140) TaxID=1229662 RepID=W3WV06_PESFW|nr:uncharacterized protein PFICI_09727 [Pestalotiopsis fici W106-1]ETS77665.1 hypothetical protein PFICI_09727 [Pestalotiopsis fici W106-1]